MLQQVVQKFSAGADTGGIGIGSVRGLRLERVGAGDAQMREGSRPAVPYETAVVEDLLEVDRGSRAVARREVASPRMYVG
jgi:hypothetical protein